MIAIDPEALLAPVAPDAPTGNNLEYDPEFTALERAATPPSESRLVTSGAVDEGPDWPEVARQALALFARTKDLRVASVLTKALLHTNGVSGLNAGVAVLRGLVERYWDSVHPQLAPDDDNDPTTRMNALRELCDRRSVLSPLRAQPLVSLTGLGSFSLRDVALATGEAQPAAGESAVDVAKVDAAFANADITQLSASADAIGHTLADAQAIERWVTGQLAVESPLSLAELTSLLGQMHKLLSTRLAARRPESGAAAPEGDAMTDVNSSQPAATRRVAAGEVSSREEVQRTLDKLCAYYEKYEPSSPVPFLLRRARRLVSMNFLEIVRDLVPSSAAEFETIRGSDNSDN
jgi:type VI secretion system protein ImpA